MGLAEMDDALKLSPTDSPFKKILSCGSASKFVAGVMSYRYTFLLRGQRGVQPCSRYRMEAAQISGEA